MASFESKASTKPASDSEIQKFPLRRLEPSIQRFLKVIEIDIDRLHKHKLNIEKLNRLEDWLGLHQEQINASRTVQQIKANVKEIEKTRKQVLDNDIEQFDQKTENMKHNAMGAVMDFLHITNNKDNEEEDQDVRSELEEKRPFLESSDPLQWTSTNDIDLVPGSLPQTSNLHQLQIHSIPENSEAMQSWEDLQESLIELNTMVHEFASSVQNQQEQIDRIEDNIEKAHDNVRDGTLQLGTASKYKAAIFPVAGALIGTALAGPVGFVVGAKIGGVAGLVGGSVLGFAGGRIIKKRQQKITDIELKNISAKRSTSLPDISSETKGKSSWLPWK